MENPSRIQDNVWKASIDHHAMQGIVTIRLAYPFGTGFVVDADLGFILTTRHLVSEPPMNGRAVFQTGAR